MRPVVIAVGDQSQYHLEERIGSGGFGMVFKGVDSLSASRNPVAIKLEPIDAARPVLEFEFRVYNELAGQRVPAVLWFGQSGDYNVLVMELMGPSLFSLWDEQESMKLERVMHFAPQMIDRVEHCHQRGILHRDLKPDNFVVTLRNHDYVCLIDFGLSKSYLNNGHHIKFSKKKPFIGTSRYASINMHDGLEQSRRDDLESLAYVLIFLAKGRLPWQGIDQKGPQRNQKIGKMKKTITPEQLCVGLPIGFAELLLYARSLRFDEEPDYKYCRELFKK